jgi:hypothetical protein
MSPLLPRSFPDENETGGSVHGFGLGTATRIFCGLPPAASAIQGIRPAV